MPRRPRIAPAGLIYHVLNRGVARLPLFSKPADYEAFERIIDLAFQRHPVRILSYCLMPNHWHFVLWPQRDGQLQSFVGWLTHTHTMRYHAHRHTSGSGHVYQGRFKNFPVQSDEHFLTLCRYVERNPLRAGLVDKAEDWPYGSLWRRCRGGESQRKILSPSPIQRWGDWLEWVNLPQTSAELESVRRSVRRSSPFGTSAWQTVTAARLGLQSTLRPQGRPRKEVTPV